MSAPNADLPLDDRSNAIKISYPILAFISTVFVVLRIWNDIIRTRKQWYLNVSDWLLAIAQVFAMGGTTFGCMTGYVGAGKHTWDPSITKHDLGLYFKYLWFAQFFNLTAMGALKFSISAFLLQLNFSRVYRWLIWLSVVVHTGLNIIYPYIILFGECDPIAKHWDPKLPGYCWSDKPRVISGYLGAGSNIASDLFCTCAPLIHTRNVRLPNRAIWGVRVVFMFGFVTTIIAAVKLYEIRALAQSDDASYESIHLSVLSISEVLVSTLTASLPPLRHLFERMLSRILPENVIGTKPRSRMPSYVLPEFSTHSNIRPKSRGGLDCDDNSEKTILAGNAASNTDLVQGRSGEIMRTTHVKLTIDDNNSPPEPRREEWA
ncbi:hypothetical protein OPT61_g2844 [Boeremia exigua]|uniref:Uncharacterized protein n=1 Tax=Boeremia exigua TaxID=749465 RepID=A0ACC2IK73_9PLEO|nr:hypothetical protein OPT61_g2844 [Boeremia exigua]